MAKIECICLEGEVCRINRVAQTVLDTYRGKEDIRINGIYIQRVELERLTKFPSAGALKVGKEFVCTRPNKCTARGGIVLKLMSLAK